ncbi:MAG: hypothetical protein K8S27_15350 [Candidatus Omnitrophica bacterium]|nr:hypothetical protein [Candidatus Omnitrophota bacterium]
MYIFYALIATAVISIIIALSSLSKEKKSGDINYSSDSPASFLSSGNDLDDIPTATDFSILQDTIIHRWDKKKKQKKALLTGTAEMKTVSGNKEEPANTSSLKQKNNTLEKLLTEKNQVLSKSQKNLNVQLEKSNGYDKIKKVLESEIHLLRKDKKDMKDELKELKDSVNSSDIKMQALETTLSSIQNLLIEKQQENQKLKSTISQQDEKPKQEKLSTAKKPASKKKGPMTSPDKINTEQSIVNLIDQHSDPDPNESLQRFGTSQIDEDSTLIDDSPNISFKDMTITSLEYSTLENKEIPGNKKNPVDENDQIKDNTSSLPNKEHQNKDQDDDHIQSHNYHGSGFEDLQNKPYQPENGSNENLFDTSYGNVHQDANPGNVDQKDGDDVYDLDLSSSYQSPELDLSNPGTQQSDTDETTLDLSKPSGIDLESYGRKIDESIKKSKKKNNPEDQGSKEETET